MAERLLKSPKKKARAETDFDTCIICQKESNETLRNLTEISFETVSLAVDARQDSTALRLQPLIESKDDFLNKTPKWHRSCRGKWTSRTNSGLVNLNINSTNSSTSTTCMPTRKSVPHFDMKHMCVICGKERMAGRRKHEKLRRVESTSVQQKIYTQAADSNDHLLLLRILGPERGKPIDMIAAKVKYHKGCYDTLRLRQVKTEHQSPYDESFNALLYDIIEPLQIGKVFYASTLKQMYQAHLSKFGLNAESVAQYRTSCLKKRLQKHFGSSLLFVPEDGQSDLVCSAHISIVELVQSLRALKRDIDENYLRVDSESEGDQNFEGDIVEEQQDVDAKMSFQVAQKIRAELKDLQKRLKEDLSQSWNVTYDRASLMVPPSLYNILALVLSDNAAFNKRHKNGRVLLDEKVKDGPNMNTQMSTHEKVLNLAQDIVFTATSIQTPQHVGLAVYVYHKTRSRDLITVLNRLGLCISYVELQRLLTSVANQITDETKDGNIFIPSNIIPGKFTQFAIDNLDFSESTLDGSSMHVTSMVMYQPSLPETVREGSFGAVPACIGRETSLCGGKASNVDLKMVTRVMGMYFFRRLAEKGCQELYIQSKDYFIPIHDVVTSFSVNETKMMPLLHALSGCDTSSYFFGKGKSTFVKVSPHFAPDLAKISDQLEQLSDVTDDLVDHTVQIATDLVAKVYGNPNYSSLDTLRVHLYARVPSLKSMPPTNDAFRQHVLRAIFQAVVLVKAMEARPSIPDPFKYEWRSTVSGVEPVRLLLTPLPSNFRNKLYCNCKQHCRKKLPLYEEEATVQSILLMQW